MNDSLTTNKNPLVTVIVPAYNMENYIEECVDSILQSTYSPLEIVIIDEASMIGRPTILFMWRKK